MYYIVMVISCLRTFVPPYPRLSLILSESSEQFVVLRFVSNGDAQTVLTKLNTVAVANDNTAVNKVVINLLGIGNLHEEEVRIGGIDLLGDG